MSFSVRKGFVSPRSMIQTKSIDSELKIAIWNAITICFLQHYPSYHEDTSDNLQKLKVRVWLHFLKRNYDEISTFNPDFLSELKQFYEKAKWHEIYDLVEFIVRNFSNDPQNPVLINFKKYLNGELKTYLAGYRLVDGLVTDITSEQELESIENALKNSGKYRNVKEHLKRALELCSDRKKPDYRNSIKESISSVEALCCIIAENKSATLGTALKVLEKKHNLHGALKNSFSSLYGYTSDADGIRHALLDENNLDQEDAIFMLVSCSSFVNYLIRKFEK